MALGVGGYTRGSVVGRIHCIGRIDHVLDAAKALVQTNNIKSAGEVALSTAAN